MNVPISSRVRALALVVATLAAAFRLSPVRAAVPPAERLLPPDTLLVITTPDFSQARARLAALPTVRLWRDPAMKPALAKFSTRWQEQLVEPLRRKWGVDADQLLTLPRGQVTFAIVPAGGPGAAPSRPAALLLVDTGTNAPQLTTQLAAFKRHWLDSGQAGRVETLRGREFMAFAPTDRALAGGLRDALFPRRVFQNVPADLPLRGAMAPPRRAPAPETGEWLIGQVDSLLLASDSRRVLEGVLARLASSDLPVLASQAAFARDGAALFRAGPLNGWANLQALMALNPDEEGASLPAETIESNPENALFLSLRTGAWLRAFGLDSCAAATFHWELSADGADFELRLARRGARPPQPLALLRGGTGDCSPPPFVPATATAFDRWRADGPGAFAALGDVLESVSPRLSSAWNFLLDTANEAARTKDPDFDLRASLQAGLGDDVIRWEGVSAVDAPADAAPPATVWVLDSPASDRLVAALRALFVLFPQQEGDAAEREFLGGKIYSVPLPGLPSGTPGDSGPRTLFYAGSTGHVVLATDSGPVEAFLRGAGAAAHPLAETPGLTAAHARVGGAGEGAFGFRDHRAHAKASLQALRDSPSAATLAPFLPLPEMLAEPLADNLNAVALMDAPLLPPFERIAKYFHFSVYGVTAGAEAWTLKVFSPMPPELKTAR